MQASFKLGFLFAVIASCSFGTIPLFTLPLMAEGIGTPSILFFRFAVSALALAVVLLVQGKALWGSLQDIGRIWFLGLFYAGSAITFFWAFRYMDSGIVATIQYCYPIIVVIMMIVFFKEPLKLTTVIASLLAFAGVAIFALDSNQTSITFLGMFFTILCSLLTALYVIGIQVLRITITSALAVTLHLMLSGSIIVGLFAVFFGGIDMPSTLPQLGNIITLGCFTGAISNIALVASVRHLGSSIAAVLGGLEPVTAMSIGVLVFDEDFMFTSALGVMSIVASVVVIMLPALTNKSRQHNEPNS